MSVLILYAKITLQDGSLATGPVTTQNYTEFLFRNTGSALDLYFSVTKHDSGWYVSSGPEIGVPQSFVDQLGRQIDQELVIK